MTQTGTHDNPIRYPIKETATVAEAKAEAQRVWDQSDADVKAGKVICLSDLIIASENVMLVSMKGEND